MKSCLKTTFQWIIIAVLAIVIHNAWLINIAEPWRYILDILAFLLLIFIVGFIFSFFTYRKDLDVLAASALHMDVRRYRKYREWYDEHQRLMKQYGIDSPEETEYFESFFRKIKNPNEWRRYQNYRMDEWKKENRKIFDNLYEDCSEEK